MKKSKKALLWTIVPVLGVSSGVAGAIAGVTSQKTSVDTNNVATTGTATTMATKSASQVVNGLRIGVQPVDTLTMSGEDTSMSTYVDGQIWSSKIKYVWKVNKGNGWVLHTSGRIGHTGITVPKTDTLLNWAFKCEVEDLTTGWKATTDEVILTIAPQVGRYVKVTQQPEAKKTVDGGQEVTLTTNAIGLKQYAKSEIGYQWFEYKGSNEFIEIEGADSSTYKFIAPSNTTTSTTKKYVCRYYIKDSKDGSKTYLSESNQSIITINKSTKEKVTFENLKASSESIKVGETTTLSVEASSTKTNKLGYQWYKLDDVSGKFEKIKDANTQSYDYKAEAEDAGKKLTFMVMASGIVQDGLQNYFQSDNLEVQVAASNGTTGTTTGETFANTLKVTSSVTTSQASVRSTFYSVGGIKTPTYSVSVEDTKSTSGLKYEWYYVGRGDKEYLISSATSNVLTTNKSLYEAAYKENSSHKVGIRCKIYKDGQLIQTVDQKTNNSFYMTVVITRR